MEYISLGSNCSVSYQLDKYNLRKNSYPFDWAKINTLGKLINILEGDFNNFSESIKFKKISIQHNLISNDNLETCVQTINLESSSIILTNDYEIEFAHEISNKYEIDEFKKILERRIDRFKKISISNTKVTFVRIELTRLKLNWKSNILKLINILEKKYINKFDLILIINKIEFDKLDKLDKHINLPNFVKIITFDNFDSDWKMNLIDWNEILNFAQI